MSREALRNVLVDGKPVLKPDFGNMCFAGSLAVSHGEFLKENQIDLKLVAGTRFDPYLEVRLG